MLIWCGENGDRFYASGAGETRNASNLLQQAKLCSIETDRLAVARRMFAFRFPLIHAGGLSIVQLRGLEGLQMRSIYASEAKRTGVEWHERVTDCKDWNQLDETNKTISVSNSILYGICHSAVVSLGYSLGLGFVHTGSMMSFVYDVADLYKAHISIPAAFDSIRDSAGSFENVLRKTIRRRIEDYGLMHRIARDISDMLGSE